MRVFLDTNVLLSAFYSHGTCTELYDHCLDAHVLFTSEFVLEEFREKAVRKLKFSPERVVKALHNIQMYSIMVSEATLPHPICKDKDDDHIVAAAVKAEVACIVTGDKEFQELKSTMGIPIVAPSDFWKFSGHHAS
ncbi:MAG: putative toxin-antitoxin system toxin component, PIN family [Candidatus Raymondbacteria bacterium RifOxyA12_full_50_37]|uniref:Putative toxin-antitoxin system toxin component, PIN family n=1 Tax=Candidatus Raymondbacteria bacterium RIFOXYD12_FULL_49_13 TaxID=1817890 RepID=A0A1F7FKR3_UNCRA|nr:MAG: putative toxin-antitoxin system toxin component, PIN family [Candidatus Raymondbacteria bacterium RifOxyA12_full_50_37]OGJ88809.1 MAG: putative toxin-antitoxin system toxin component, PIN family [Candidatus Raymondbacteria bacterium RIFOXYA2_FULL_49_16]OGJ96568.1 MAG: putative toxin-antitoxin system toxin component, PIN family [Candidatus Raymondbacteria bacterium RIFOXYC2_FULL_50_21]OGJ99663.1 MAG: putative toxin-antitoxin system toxin component, PIN family [Candidatus Raymondbacteria b